MRGYSRSHPLRVGHEQPPCAENFRRRRERRWYGHLSRRKVSRAFFFFRFVFLETFFVLTIIGARAVSCMRRPDAFLPRYCIVALSWRQVATVETCEHFIDCGGIRDRSPPHGAQHTKTVTCSRFFFLLHKGGAETWMYSTIPTCRQSCSVCSAGRKVIKK